VLPLPKLAPALLVLLAEPIERSSTERGEPERKLIPGALCSSRLARDFPFVLDSFSHGTFSSALLLVVAPASIALLALLLPSFSMVGVPVGRWNPTWRCIGTLISPALLPVVSRETVGKLETDPRVALVRPLKQLPNSPGEGETLGWPHEEVRPRLTAPLAPLLVPAARAKLDSSHELMALRLNRLVFLGLASTMEEDAERGRSAGEQDNSRLPLLLLT